MPHGSSSPFINRDAEKALVRQSLEQLKHRVPVKENVINFYGLPGIGKTTLLHELYHAHQQDDQVLTMWLDLATLSAESDPEAAMWQFIQALAHPEHISQGHTTLQPCLEQSISQGTTPDIAAERVVACLAALDKPILLLLDSWEHVSDTLFAWVERAVLLKLVQTERMFAVLNSHMGLRWRQFGVRRRARDWMLEPFTQQQTQQQIDCSDDISRAVFAITFGHPYANEVVLEHLHPHRHSVQWLERHAAPVAAEVVEALLTRTVHDDSGEIRRALEVLALFREFDVNTLRTILPMFLDEFAHRTQPSLIMTIKRMQESKIVSWDHTKRAYQIDPTLRKIFARALRLKNPERYAAIRSAAVEYYASLVREVSGSRNIYLLEYYYHLLLAMDIDEHLEYTIHKSFEQFLRQYYVSPNGRYLDTEALGELATQIERDQELQAIFERQRLSHHILLDSINDLHTSDASIAK
jgi:transposase InsO family protein